MWNDPLCRRDSLRPSVTSVTPSRQFVGVAGATLAASVMVVALASCGDPVDADSRADAGVADARADVDPYTSPRRREMVDYEPPHPAPEPLCALTGAPVPTPGDTLVFSDDFDGDTVDTVHWSLVDGFRRNGVLSYAAPDQIAVRNGTLFVSAVPNGAPRDPVFPYDAGFLNTLHKFARTYGRIEFTARFPFEQGVWFALWGRPWDASFPEIDIEVVNRNSTNRSELYFVNHWAAPPLPADERRSFVLLKEADYAQTHTYSVIWKPGVLEWQVDGVTKMKADPRGIPSSPVHWMINTWVGGWSGSPNATTKFPVTFEVDSVRVYRLDGLVAPPAILLPSKKTRWSRRERLPIAVANLDEVCAHVVVRDRGVVVWETSTAPYTVPIALFGDGAHPLEITVTDGERSASVAVEIQVGK